jgi:MFS family permease
VREAYRQLISNRGFLQIWSAALVSGLGDRIATIALYLLVFRISGRPLDLGLLAAVQILPAVLLGPVTGLLLDRWNRRLVMVVSDCASAVVVALLPFAASVPAVYLLACLLAVGRQFTGPARLALIPDLVAAEQLGAANALTLATRNVLLLVGPAVGGALVATYGTAPAFWIDAGSFLASALILFVRAPRPIRHAAAAAPVTDSTQVPLAAAAAAAGSDVDVAAFAGDPVPGDEPAPGGGPAPQDVQPADEADAGGRRAGGWQAVRAGARLVFERPRLRFAFLLFGAMTFVTAMQQPLVVAFVKGTLAGSDVQLGLIISAAGFGGIVGAPLGVLGRRSLNPLRRVVWLMAVDGALLIVFAANRDIVVAALLFAAFGTIAAMGQVAIATFLQQETPERFRGRVFGWLGTWIGPLSLASVFVGPLAAGVLGAATILAISGAFELLVGFVGRARLPAPAPPWEAPVAPSGPPAAAGTDAEP